MLEVKNIVKSFGRNRVLNKISFKVNKGDIVSVIGPSGSGKSTLLRCINHLEEPNSGKIIFNTAISKAVYRRILILTNMTTGACCFISIK